MKLVIGLGNPGIEYEKTRHNIGFLMVDHLYHNWKLDKKYDALLSEKKQDGSISMKPQTFMNLSGKSVQAFVHFYKLNPQKDILVISDDIDMEFGKVRFRSQGSHGGQNGLRNIIEALGTEQFARIKIGIGRDSGYSVNDWVLSRLTDAELQSIDSEIIQKVENSLKDWISS